MKYQVGDKFEDRKNNVSVEITSYNPYNGVYIVATRYKNNGLPYDTNYTDTGLDDLIKTHNWTYVPVNKATATLALGFQSNWFPYVPSGAFAGLDLTPNVLGSANELKCSHSLYEEKVLFTSWYKICLSCKKEFE